MNIRTGFFIAALILTTVPSFVFAAVGVPNTNVWDPSILKGPLVTCWGSPVDIDPNTGAATQNANACQNLCDLVATFINVVYFGIGLVIWILAPLFFGIAGVMYLIAGASPEMISKANQAIRLTVIGLLIVTCGWLVLSLFINVLGIGGIGGFGGGAVCTPPPLPA